MARWTRRPPSPEGGGITKAGGGMMIDEIQSLLDQPEDELLIGIGKSLLAGSMGSPSLLMKRNTRKAKAG